MKVISLLQPWATLAVLGHKKVETRSWDTKHRGPLLIHASASKKGLNLLSNGGCMADGDLVGEIERLGLADLNYTLGAIIGQVNLAETFQFGGERSIQYIDEVKSAGGFPAIKQELSFGDWNAGRYGWLFTAAEEFFLPTPAKGKLQLWDFDESELMVFPNDLDKIKAK